MKMPSARWVRRVALGAAVLLAAGFAVGSLAPSQRDNEMLSQARSGYSNDVAGYGGRGTEAFALTQKSVSAGGTGPATVAAPDQASALPPLPDRIVKTGELTLEVKAARFEDAWKRASAIASSLGGYVSGSSRGTVSSGDARDRMKNGEITIRIPSARFDAAMAELRKIGEVAGDNVGSQDVTQEFTDLESRLRNLKAQEAVLLRLMGTAKSVQDTLVVQQQLSNVQSEIEQIQGRLKLLRSLTEMSTINVHILEPGAAGLLGAGDRPSFAQAWETALEGLLRMATVAMIAAVWLIPFLVLALLARTFLRRRPPVAEQG